MQRKEGGGKERGQGKERGLSGIPVKKTEYVADRELLGMSRFRAAAASEQLKGSI